MLNIPFAAFPYPHDNQGIYKKHTSMLNNQETSSLELKKKNLIPDSRFYYLVTHKRKN